MPSSWKPGEPFSPQTYSPAATPNNPLRQSDIGPGGVFDTVQVAHEAVTGNAVVVDNTHVNGIGTTDTSIGAVTIDVISVIDIVAISGRVQFSFSGYDITAGKIITSKLWRGAVGTGTVVDTNTGALTATGSTANLTGNGTMPFNFYDFGIKGLQTYSVSLAVQAGPTINKLSTVIITIDHKA